MGACICGGPLSDAPQPRLQHVVAVQELHLRRWSNPYLRGAAQFLSKPSGDRLFPLDSSFIEGFWVSRTSASSMQADLRRMLEDSLAPEGQAVLLPSCGCSCQSRSRRVQRRGPDSHEGPSPHAHSRLSSAV